MPGRPANQPQSVYLQTPVDVRSAFHLELRSALVLIPPTPIPAPILSTSASMELQETLSNDSMRSNYPSNANRPSANRRDASTGWPLGAADNTGWLTARLDAKSRHKTRAFGTAHLSISALSPIGRPGVALENCSNQEPYHRANSAFHPSVSRH